MTTDIVIEPDTNLWIMASVPSSTIACVIPAYNEENSIGATIQSLLTQTRPPNSIFVIVNNSVDDTVWEAKKFEGEHLVTSRGTDFNVVVIVIDIGKNKDKKVGALNFGWTIAKDFTYILGVDGDTILDKKCINFLEQEMDSDSRIGGISAIYSFDTNIGKGFFQKFLVAGQRQQFAGFEMDNLLRGRNMTVLGGQCSLLRVSTLKEVMNLNRQSTPWVTDSSVEDSLLSLQIKSAGYLTKISSRARANVGAMLSMKSLYAQQVKWTVGAIELMKQRPFHPNLRLRWRENISMLFNIFTRFGFAILLFASLNIGAFLFNPVWLIPVIVAWFLSIRISYSMHERSGADTFFAWSFILAELYTWIRISHFVASWYQFFAKIEKDNWDAQANAEAGKGSSGILWSVLALSIVSVIIYTSWTTMDVVVQSTILSIGWPILAVISVLLTLTMLSRLVRRHRSFTV